MIAEGGVAGGRRRPICEYPNRVRVETTLPGVGIGAGLRRPAGWVRDPSGVHDVPEPARARASRPTSGATRSRCCSRPSDGALRARLLPDVKDEAGRVHHALELSGTGLDPLVLYVDPATGLIVEADLRRRRAGRPLIEEVFSDYRPVDGVQIAFTATMRRGGQPCSNAASPTSRSTRRSTRALQTSRVLTARLLLSCGEPSGDLYAGALTRELRPLDPASPSAASAVRSSPPPAAS